MPTPAFVISRAPAFLAPPPSVTPAGAVRGVSEISPAGQTSTSSGGGSFEDLLARYSGSASTTTSGGGTGSTSGASSSTSSQQQLYATIGSAIGTVGSVVQAIINSGSQADRDALAARTAVQIATLNAEATQAREAGETARADALARQATATQAAATQLGLAQSQNTTMLIIAGIAGVVVLGGVAIWAFSRPRRNPSRRRHRRY